MEKKNFDSIGVTTHKSTVVNRRIPLMRIGSARRENGIILITILFFLLAYVSFCFDFLVYQFTRNSTNHFKHEEILYLFDERFAEKSFFFLPYYLIN